MVETILKCSVCSINILLLLLGVQPLLRRPYKKVSINLTIICRIELLQVKYISTIRKKNHFGNYLFTGLEQIHVGSHLNKYKLTVEYCF